MFRLPLHGVAATSGEFVSNLRLKAALRIQRAYRIHCLRTSTSLQEERDDPDKCDSIGSDYCNTACRQCGELFSLDPDAADACDLCLLPFHSHCLKVVEHPLEDYTICLDCGPKAEALRHELPRQTRPPQSKWMPIKALLIRML